MAFLLTGSTSISPYVIQVTKDEKPETERIDHLHITYEDFDKISEIKTQKDDITRQQLTMETITVGRGDVTRLEETERPKYPKDLDVGRIVIEEIPEEKEEIPKREVPKKEQIRPKSIEVTATNHEVEEHPKTYVTEDVIKVGKLDVTHLEKEMVEAKTVQERIKTYKDRVDGARKVNNLSIFRTSVTQFCCSLTDCIETPH